MQKHSEHLLQELRLKVKCNRIETLSDGDLLMIVLSGSPGNTEHIRRLLNECGSLNGVFSAKPYQLKDLMEHCSGLAESPSYSEWPATEDNGLDLFLKALKELLGRVLRERIAQRPIINSWSAVIDYLKFTIGNESTEYTRILYLDKSNALILDDAQKGTVNHVQIYVREVVKRALEIDASAVILAHNHPSGNPEPSKADIDVTRKIIDGLATFNILFHDHIILTRNRHISLKSSGLI